MAESDAGMQQSSQQRREQQRGQSQRGQTFQQDNQGTRQGLREVTWSEVDEAGAYVELSSGDLFRIPEEALITGGSPVISRVSRDGTRLVQLSNNAMIPILKARELSADNNIEPNF